MIERGRVARALDNNIVEVELATTSSCAKCGVCRVGGEGRMILLARNEIGARVGDNVKIEIPTGQTLKMTFLIFIFPILALLLGYFAGMQVTRSETGGIISALIFTIIAFLILFAYDKYLKQKNECKASITQIVKT